VVVRPVVFEDLYHLAWYRKMGPLIGFGYHASNAFYFSLVLILFGSFIFHLGHRVRLIVPKAGDACWNATGQLKDNHPKFCAFVYSLETFVPLVKLEMAQYWIPSAQRRATLRPRDLLPKWLQHCPSGSLSPPRSTHSSARLSAAMPSVGVFGQLLVWLGRVRFALPGNWIRLYLWIHTLAGWVFTTLWVGAFTGLLKH
jgi:hypothetical protein